MQPRCVLKGARSDLVKKEVISLSDLILLLLFVGIGSLWFLGRNYPLTAESQQQIERQSVDCATCLGSGTLKCPACGGFGTVEVKEECPTCKGTGHHPGRSKNGPEVTCRKCKGTGKHPTRTTCTVCNGSGKVTCSTCSGTGKIGVTKTNVTYAVIMEPSLWETCLGFVGVPPDANPRPLKDADGRYPIVTKYLESRFPKQPFQVPAWGTFCLAGDEWKMTATIRYVDKAASIVSNEVEFTVKDRRLSSGSIIRPCPALPESRGTGAF